MLVLQSTHALVFTIVNVFEYKIIDGIDYDAGKKLKMKLTQSDVLRIVHTLVLKKVTCVCTLYRKIFCICMYLNLFTVLGREVTRN